MGVLDHHDGVGAGRQHPAGGNLGHAPDRQFELRQLTHGDRTGDVEIGWKPLA